MDYKKQSKEMKIKIYAALKDFFGPEMESEKQLRNIEELKAYLVRLKPESEKVLRSSRFAVEDAFVSQDYQFSAHETVSVIPPSSGG